MEHSEIRSLLEVIEQQVSSSILGGMEAQYEELENLGYIVINREDVQHAASITDAGRAFLERTENGFDEESLPGQPPEYFK